MLRYHKLRRQHTYEKQEAERKAREAKPKKAKAQKNQGAQGQTSQGSLTPDTGGCLMTAASTDGKHAFPASDGR
jgi:isoaspartyl peptidase/L-asparaginase-like protein (Ntn-hydrolase superfamily)